VTLVLSTSLLYGCENWVMTRPLHSELRSFYNRCVFVGSVVALTGSQPSVKKIYIVGRLGRNLVLEVFTITTSNDCWGGRQGMFHGCQCAMCLYVIKGLLLGLSSHQQVIGIISSYDRERTRSS
jgi:hypothetical protein